MNIWSVVGMVIGIIMGSFGIILTIVSSNVIKQLDLLRVQVTDHSIDLKACSKRIEILERANDVTTNELRHINAKLDELIIFSRRKK